MKLKDNNVFPKAGAVIANLSLILAILAFIPSAVFSGAIIISLFAFLGALMGALSGWNRVSIITIYIVIMTFLINPISSWIESYIDIGSLAISSAIIGVLLTIVLVINYFSIRKLRVR